MYQKNRKQLELDVFSKTKSKRFGLETRTIQWTTLFSDVSQLVRVDDDDKDKRDELLNDGDEWNVSITRLRSCLTTWNSFTAGPNLKSSRSWTVFKSSRRSRAAPSISFERNDKSTNQRFFSRRTTSKSTLLVLVSFPTQKNILSSPGTNKHRWHSTSKDFSVRETKKLSRALFEEIVRCWFRLQLWLQSTTMLTHLLFLEGPKTKTKVKTMTMDFRWPGWWTEQVMNVDFSSRDWLNRSFDSSSSNIPESLNASFCLVEFVSFPQLNHKSRIDRSIDRFQSKTNFHLTCSLLSLDDRSPLLFDQVNCPTRRDLSFRDSHFSQADSTSPLRIDCSSFVSCSFAWRCVSEVQCELGNPAFFFQCHQPVRFQYLHCLSSSLEQRRSWQHSNLFWSDPVRISVSFDDSEQLEVVRHPFVCVFRCSKTLVAQTKWISSKTLFRWTYPKPNSYRTFESNNDIYLDKYHQPVSYWSD